MPGRDGVAVDMRTDIEEGRGGWRVGGCPWERDSREQTDGPAQK